MKFIQKNRSNQVKKKIHCDRITFNSNPQMSGVKYQKNQNIDKLFFHSFFPHTQHKKRHEKFEYFIRLTIHRGGKYMKNSAQKGRKTQYAM